MFTQLPVVSNLLRSTASTLLRIGLLSPVHHWSMMAFRSGAPWLGVHPRSPYPLVSLCTHFKIEKNFWTLWTSGLRSQKSSAHPFFFLSVFLCEPHAHAPLATQVRRILDRVKAIAFMKLMKLATLAIHYVASHTLPLTFPTLPYSEHEHAKPARSPSHLRATLP